MNSLQLQDVPRVKSISKSDFIKHYYKPQKPVVIETLINDWPAYSKWNLEYIKDVAGETEVPLYNGSPIHHKKKFNEPDITMKMSDYIDLLKREPTRLRIFLWNIFKTKPQLQNDFSFPDIGFRIIKRLPMLFFGGKGAHTFMHYDIDLANVLHFHFEGKKQCILFNQKQNKYIYKVPHSIITREDINFADPDFEKWPALKYAKGWVCNLNHGEVLYMPEGYWHYMRYLTPGFSMSLRALPKRSKNLKKAIYNVLFMRNFDNLMRRIIGQKWIDWKNNKAIVLTNKFLKSKNINT